MNVRELKPTDTEMLNRHKQRHSLENGRDGDVIFAPVEENWTVPDEAVKRDLEALTKPPTEIGWLRIWIVTDENEIFGALNLRSNGFLYSFSRTIHLRRLFTENSDSRQSERRKMLFASLDNRSTTRKWIYVSGETKISKLIPHVDT